VTQVIAGPSAEVHRATTIPLAVRPGSATLVLKLASPLKLPLRGLPGQKVDEIALAAADPTQAALALSRLGVDAPTPPTAEQRRAGRYLTFALGTSLVGTALIVVTIGALSAFGPSRLSCGAPTEATIAIGVGLAWLKVKIDPPPASLPTRRLPRGLLQRHLPALRDLLRAALRLTSP
jgi:hypothetical protein